MSSSDDIKNGPTGNARTVIGKTLTHVYGKILKMTCTSQSCMHCNSPASDSCLHGRCVECIATNREAADHNFELLSFVLMQLIRYLLLKNMLLNEKNGVIGGQGYYEGLFKPHEEYLHGLTNAFVATVNNFIFGVLMMTDPKTPCRFCKDVSLQAIHSVCVPCSRKNPSAVGYKRNIMQALIQTTIEMVRLDYMSVATKQKQLICVYYKEPSHTTQQKTENSAILFAPSLVFLFLTYAKKMTRSMVNLILSILDTTHDCRFCEKSKFAGSVWNGICRDCESSNPDATKASSEFSLHVLLSIRTVLERFQDKSIQMNSGKTWAHSNFSFKNEFELFDSPEENAERVATRVVKSTIFNMVGSPDPSPCIFCKDPSKPSFHSTCLSCITSHEDGYAHFKLVMCSAAQALKLEIEKLIAKMTTSSSSLSSSSASSASSYTV